MEYNGKKYGKKWGGKGKSTVNRAPFAMNQGSPLTMNRKRGCLAPLMPEDASWAEPLKIG